MPATMSSPPLTIITICYNERDGIEATCSSIAGQTWQNFEWIVIDGGSTDGTLDILEKYRDRINIFVSEKDDGLYHAMNKGIKLASGAYLNFMNAGDYLFDRYVLAHLFSQNLGDADIIYGDAIYLTSERKATHFQYPENLTRDFFSNNCISHQASLIKRELFDRYGLYNEQNKIISDWEKWIVFMHGGASFVRYGKLIAVHQYSGISSHLTTGHLRERHKIIEQYFGLKQKPVMIKKHKLFNSIVLYKTFADSDGRKITVKLLGFIPILRIKTKN